MVVLGLSVSLFVIVECVKGQSYGMFPRETHGRGHAPRETDLFTYDTNMANRYGVNNWPISFGEECGGETQSPVNIRTDSVIFNPFSCPRRIIRSKYMRGELKNNGKTLVFECEDHHAYRLTNIPHRHGIYNLHEFHVHYGGLEGRLMDKLGHQLAGRYPQHPGSEHTINNIRMSGEIHFVFYKDEHGHLENAARHEDGLVVLSILVQTVSSTSPHAAGFSRFLERHVPKLLVYPSSMNVEVDVNMFLNQDCDFYTYFGSTTTPRCHEAVQWVIFREPIRITERAWFQLTKMSSRGDFNSRYGNYRNSRPLNDRIVEANFPLSKPLVSNKVVLPQFSQPISKIVAPSVHTNPLPSLPHLPALGKGESLYRQDRSLIQWKPPGLQYGMSYFIL